jgi:hypothetical protein
MYKTALLVDRGRIFPPNIAVSDPPGGRLEDQLESRLFFTFVRRPDRHSELISLEHRMDPRIRLVLKMIEEKQASIIFDLTSASRSLGLIGRILAAIVPSRSRPDPSRIPQTMPDE